MKKYFLFFLLVFTLLITQAQNVGIGTTTPTDARLQVQNPGSTTQGMFTDGSTGVSLLTDFGRPSIGLNMFLNSGFKFKGAGYGGLLWYLPTSGNFHYYSSNAAGAAGGPVTFGSSLLTIQADGNVGISATPTEAKLQVHDPAGNTQFIAAAGNNLPGISTFVPVSSPSIGFNARYQGGYKFMGTGYGGFFQFSPSLGRLQYWYSSTSGTADGALGSALALTIDSSGQLGIGTSAPKAPLHVTGNIVFGGSTITPATGYKVSVDGKIICEELKVQTSGAWPDYVFEDDYVMPTLENLEARVMSQKHLPGIPAAAQVEADKGVEVGDMQTRLLEKVEELYRYMFQLNKENKQLKERLTLIEGKRKK